MASDFDPALFNENARTAPSAETRLFASVGELPLQVGATLPDVTLAYETWGTLNDARDNAILVCHALSGDSHAVGWWDRLVGPGKAIDTDRFFVICSNVLGGCQGSTGPSSLAADGRPYGSRFPMILVEDMVLAQSRLISALGIERLFAVAGGSMGGMQALEWSRQFPDRVARVFVTASTASHSPMQIGFNEVARQAILRDPNYAGGDYSLENAPKAGLAVGRMLGHISFLSASAFQAKFGRRLQKKDRPSYTFGVEFEVESYLSYQADKFTTRFDANSLLHLTRAIDYYEFSPACSGPRYCVVCFESDWLYPPSQSEEIHQMVLDAGCESSFHNIPLPYGHDAFLLDGEIQGEIVRDFLR